MRHAYNAFIERHEVAWELVMAALASAVVALIVGGCSSLPTPECPPSLSALGSQVTVDCDDAVAAAAPELPADHPKVVRVQVVPGDFRAVYGGFGSDAHVVFTYSTGSRVAVPLYVEDTTGELIPDEIGSY